MMTVFEVFERDSGSATLALPHTNTLPADSRRDMKQRKWNKVGESVFV